MTIEKLTVSHVARTLGLAPKSVRERRDRGESLEKILERGRVSSVNIQRPLKYTYQGKPISSAQVAKLAGVARITAKIRLAAGESTESIIATGKKTTNKFLPGDEMKPSTPFTCSVTGLSKYAVQSLLKCKYSHTQIAEAVALGMKIYHKPRSGVYEFYHPDQLTVKMVEDRTKLKRFQIERRLANGESLENILLSR